MKVLIVEDEVDSVQLLTLYLESKGHIVDSARNGLEALEQFRNFLPDIILLDIRIPHPDGWRVLEIIRHQSQVPVILLTALDSSEDVVKGLSLGADDYLRKPFQFNELEARIQAVSRRSQNQSDAYSASPLTEACRLDDKNKTVTIKGKIISLSRKEYDLFKLLARNPGEIVSIQEILARLWPSPSRADASDVKQYIYLLRNKIKENVDSAYYIETIKGFGYRLRCQSCGEEFIEP